MKCYFLNLLRATLASLMDGIIPFEIHPVPLQLVREYLALVILEPGLFASMWTTGVSFSCCGSKWLCYQG